MSAWIEIDRLGPDVRSTPEVWDRVALETARTLPLWSRARHSPGDVDVGWQRHDLVAGEVHGFGWRHLVDISHKGGGRFFIRARAPAIAHNGVTLVVDEPSPLESGDRIEVLSGTQLRFTDDSVPLALPRLRACGRAFLFAPTPADGALRWRALLPGRADVLLAVRPRRADEDDEPDEDLLRAAFPAVVELLQTPRGAYALLEHSAGVPLGALLERTREQGAALDQAWVAAMSRALRRCFNHATGAGWHSAVDDPEEVIVTWEGRTVWLGFTPPFHARTRTAVALRELEALDVDPYNLDAVTPDDERALASVVARLFPDEHAAELLLREEAALWTREGPAAPVERASGGRP